MKTPNLKNLTDGELAAEVQRRAKLARTLPEPLANPDYSKLRRYLIRGTEDTARGDTPKDFEHYIYEAAIEAVYGDDYWRWINNL